MRVDFALIVVVRILDAADHSGFERIALFEQFIDTFRISAFAVRQSLQISRFHLSGYQRRAKRIRRIILSAPACSAGAAPARRTGGGFAP